MSERFELLDTAGDISGKLRLIYGTGPADPAPFILTLTPEYVARASGKAPPVSLHKIENTRTRRRRSKGNGFQGKRHSAFGSYTGVTVQRSPHESKPML